MSLPVDNTITWPSAVQPWPNGKLPTSVLAVTTGFNGGPDLVLCAVATRAFTALAGACHAATGIALRTTGRADSYRSYDIQAAVFRIRYTTAGPTSADHVGVVWNGVRWWRKPGYAQAAVPGTSNHGKAIAVDWANYAAALGWLTAHSAQYGISWELQSEPWHQRYNDGDRLPAAVLKWEAQQTMTVYLQLTDQGGKIWVSNAVQRYEFPGDVNDLDQVRAAVPGQVVAIFANDLPNWGADVATAPPPAGGGNPVPGNYEVTGTFTLTPADE